MRKLDIQQPQKQRNSTPRQESNCLCWGVLQYTTLKNLKRVFLSLTNYEIKDIKWRIIRANSMEGPLSELNHRGSHPAARDVLQPVIFLLPSEEKKASPLSMSHATLSEVEQFTRPSAASIDWDAWKTWWYLMCVVAIDKSIFKVILSAQVKIYMNLPMNSFKICYH